MEMKFYAAPEVELVEVAVEAGFANSNTGFGEGGVPGGGLE